MSTSERVISVGLSAGYYFVDLSTFLRYNFYTMIKKTDFAYISGYIDGDGCFYIGKTRSKKRLKYKHVVRIVISSVNKYVLDSFKDMFGGSVALIHKEKNNSKAQYHYVISKRCTLDLAKNIFPYLVEKREECDLAIQFASSEITDKDIFINRMNITKDTVNLISKYHKKEFESVRNIIKPTEEDFAYLAGFIDAECCLGIQKYRVKNKPNYVYKIQLQCNNTKAPVFKWILERFGGQLHFIDRRNQKARRNQLTWRLTGKALSQILDRIHPFLKHKKPVCEELMKFYATTLLNGGARHTDTFRNQYADIIKIREDIVTKVHLLNFKGVKIKTGG